jgi:hypothetical protein
VAYEKTHKQILKLANMFSPEGSCFRLHFVASRVPGVEGTPASNDTEMEGHIIPTAPRAWFYQNVDLLFDRYCRPLFLNLFTGWLIAVNDLIRRLLPSCTGRHKRKVTTMIPVPAPQIFIVVYPSPYLS